MSRMTNSGNILNTYRRIFYWILKDMLNRGVWNYFKLS
jgi:hypothetical protein